MRHVTSWLIGISVVTGLGAGATSFAQPNVRDHRHPGEPPPAAPPPPEHDRHVPPPPAAGPTEAPPPPREERQAARAGFLWIPGKWDWRGRWEWVAGHWERERAGQRWNPGRWDRQGDRWIYVEGGWAAGGDHRDGDHRDGDHRDGDHRDGDHDGRPHIPPPAPRSEQIQPRAGFVFVRGRWDWRGDNWAWVDGHWERERSGKQWREARWEQRDGAYVLIDGEWIDTGIVPPPNGGPPPPPPPPMMPPTEDHPDHWREWRRERPMVSSYWPTRGRIGSRIVIHGDNFPPDTTVLWGGTQVNAAKVSANEIVVQVPVGATSSTVLLHAGRRDLIVGNFEVAADYDAAAAAAEAQRLADESRRRAEQAWTERQRTLAKDRAARQAEYDRRLQEMDSTREQRRQDRLREIRARWQAAFLADADTQSELTLHAERVADLERMREVAELSENGKLVVRIGVAASREDQRHDERMTALHDSFGRKP